MALSKTLKDMVADRFGRPILVTHDCGVLSQAILESIGETLGETTLKRMFGFVGNEIEPRTSSLDVLAHYLGYSDYAALELKLNPDAEISDFAVRGLVDCATLPAGSGLTVGYRPDRAITFEALGNRRFRVTASANSKLEVGDVAILSYIVPGFEMVATEVIRDGVSLGSYSCGRHDGIASVKILPV